MGSLSALGTAVVGEVAFATPTGAVDAAVVHPLVHDGGVVLALPFARRGLADALASARSVALVSSDGRLVLRDWSPVAATGRMRVSADLEGRWFARELLDQELRRYPPARLLADSLIQRREYWWYLPRLLCHFGGVSWEAPVGAREDPEGTGVLAWDAAEGLRADAVAVTGHGDDRVVVRTLAGAPISGAADPACLLLHDFSVPDFERRAELVLQGRLEGDVLVVERRRGNLPLPGPPSLLQRWRLARRFSRACRVEIARARAQAAAGEPVGEA